MHLEALHNVRDIQLTNPLLNGTSALGSVRENVRPAGDLEDAILTACIGRAAADSGRRAAPSVDSMERTTRTLPHRAVTGALAGLWTCVATQHVLSEMSKGTSCRRASRN